MIEYYNGNIADIMPDSLKHRPEVKAVGYAISNMIKKIVDASRKSGVYSAIDILDEDVLDLLAVELRTKYYGGWLTLEEKKKIIKKTLSWYCKAGTPYAVQELVDFVFQDAVAEEWFQYGSSAFLFRVMVNVISQDISMEKFQGFLQAVYGVKNTRSHLEAVIFTYRKDTEVKTVAAGGLGNTIKIKARVARKIGTETEGMPVSALFLNQNILVKTDNEVKEGEVYTLSDEGQKIRVLTEDGCIVRTEGA